MNEILNYFNQLYPSAHCELLYTKDYELLLAVMLSAQTTDKRVNQVTTILFHTYPTLEDLRDASIEDIINIIRPLGTWSRKAQNIHDIASALLEQSHGVVPNDRTFLEGLNGVGHKTANVVLNNLFGEPCIAVDTHVARVSTRLGLAKQSDNVKQIESKLMKKFPKDQWGRLHHQLVLFGRYHCKASKPQCDSCQLQSMCCWYKKQYQKAKKASC